MTQTRKKGGAQRIDYNEAEQMLRAGKTQQEIADRFGVTQAAISAAIKRGAIKHAYEVEMEGRAMPWRVRQEHQHRYLARMIRAWHRRQHGLKSAPPFERMLDSFLESVDRDGFVVTYLPDIEEGFVRVERRPGIDDHPLLRRDDLDERGRRVRGTEEIRKFFTGDDK